jgi:OmpA-OmpF porin, OOP family
MRPLRVFTIVLAVCAAAVAARAQDDAENSKDHPMFSRMPGYYINEYDAQDFAPFKFELLDNKQVEGKYWHINYRLKDGAKKYGPLQIGRNYIDLIVKRGGKKLFEDIDSGGGTTIAQLPVSGGRNLWVQVWIGDSGAIYVLDVMEEAAMEQVVEFSASDLAEKLNSSGSVALHGILFDTAKATIKPESAPTLQAVAEALKADAALKVEIQGHTDNVGAAAANLKLSQDRAAAVKAYLVQQHGVAAARLTTAGFGDTKPVAPNTTDEGKAQNRRVELVKK